MKPWHWALVGAGLLLLAARRLEAVLTGEPTTDVWYSWEDLTMRAKSLTGYAPAKVPEQYRDLISASEQASGLPPGMLARLLWQESRYRPDIIDGRTKSRVGALGIAQFMPATAAELRIDPLDPAQAIPAAGMYLARLRRMTPGGTWAEALAAYNWGIGNVKRKGLDAAPAETLAYYSEILNDIGMLA